MADCVIVTDIELEHCQRVASACAQAIRHVTQLLSESTQAFVNEILANPGPDRIASCLAQINKREAATDAEGGLLDALKILVTKLWKYETGLTRHHFPRVLLLCWNGVAEELDRQAKGERWEGGSGPRQTSEMTYHDEVITPMIRASFETLWEEQAKLKKKKLVEAR